MAPPPSRRLLPLPPLLSLPLLPWLLRLPLRRLPLLLRWLLEGAVAAVLRRLRLSYCRPA
jgi:hypothetical protein